MKILKARSFILLFILLSCSLLEREDGSGPTLEILFPKDHFVMETNALPAFLDIWGTAADVSGVRSVKVSVNGGGFVKAEGQSNWHYTITMGQLGDYQIDIFAVDQNYNVGLTHTLRGTLKFVSNL